MKALFDTNILIDLLNGRSEANTEVGLYSSLSISRISWIEVLAGVRDAEDQNRVENLLGFFEMFELNEGVAREAITLRPTRFARETPALQPDYDNCWSGFEKAKLPAPASKRAP